MGDNEVTPADRGGSPTVVVDITSARPPGLLRRVAAMAYDLVLLLALLVLAAALLIVPWVELSGSDEPVGGSWWFRLYLLAVVAAYFSYFWSHGGQTLGMRAWRMRLLREDGTPIGPADAFHRLLWAVVALTPAGIGLLWVLLDRNGLAWHDRLSHTRLVLVERT